MSITITGKLNKAANQFAAGESTGFGIRLGVQYYDRDTKQKEWTNYECVIFAKAPAQIQFYQNTLVEGAVIEVTGEQAKINIFEGQNGPQHSIELLNARLGYVFSPNSQQAPRAQQAQQRKVEDGRYSGAISGQHRQSPQQQQQYAPQQQAPQGAYDDFAEDKIPF